MAKQSSSAEKSATKQPAKPPPTSTSMGGVAELAPEALGVFNVPSLHGQADRLGNTNLQAVQRQMLATRIGQTQGNGHLQQIVAFSRQQAPYQSNIVHRSPAVRHDAREQAQPTQESIADEQLAEIWGIESGLLATSANPTPKPTGTTVSVQRDAEAETLPTEAEKAAARAKAAAAEARAEQTSNQGRAQTDQARASQAAEQTTGQAAKQKASSARTAAAGKKAAPAKEIAVNGAGHGGAQQAGPVEGVSDGTLNATNGNQAKAPASAAEDPGFQSVVGKVKGVADQEQTHAPAATKAKEAQAAAESPASELAGKAQSGQVEQMDAAETPGFNAAAFKQKLMARIEALTPKNAADADEFKEKNKAGALKGELQNETAAQKEQSQAPLAAAASQTPNTGNVEPKATTPLAGNPAGRAPALAGAEAATPKPKGQGEVEAPMQAQSQQLDQQMADASVTEEQLAKSNEPEFQSAVTAKTESQAHAQTAPQAYRQDEQGVIQGAQAEATATVQGQTSAMHAERTGLMAQVDSQQVQGKSADEQKRAEVGAHIQTIYDKTKSTVEQILTSLDSEVDQLFNQGAEAAKQSFENYVEAKMDAYKEKRYGGMLGWAQWLADKIQPTQPEVFAIFAAGRDHYIAQMGAVIDNVVALIGRKLAEAKAEIASGKQEIQEYVSKLPADLQQVGQEAAQNIQSQFDELTQSIDAKQDELIDTLANKYNEKLQAVDARIEQLKAENETIYDKAANAIDGVIKTIQQLKQMMASILARAQSAIELIAADPIGFLGKLIDGVKLGLNNFMGNIGKHLETGFVTWLTGTVSKAGITLPDNWDLPGIFQLVMQLLGLGFDQLISRVSQLLGFDVMGFIEPIQQVIEIYQAEGFTGLAKMGLERLIGKEHMESLMHVWGIVQNVISGKWAALWGMLQEFLGNLKEMVFDQIIQYISEQVIKGGITWMLSLFNPVGAFIKACKAIYDIIMFFVNNGKQIMALVDAVINSVSAIATGNISAAATAIENALAKGIPVAIGFLASLLNLGDIGEKVQKIIQSVRGVVEKGLNAVFNSKPVQMVAGFIKKVIGKIKGGIAKGVNWAKGKLGFGEDETDTTQDKQPNENEAAPPDQEQLNPIHGPVGEEIVFGAGGEDHRLWIDESQEHPQVMVASQQETVGAKLARWQVEASGLGSKEGEARELLTEAIKCLSDTERTAHQAELLKRNAQILTSPITEQFKESDQNVTNNERRLSTILRRLFVLFGEQKDEGKTIILEGQLGLPSEPRKHYEKQFPFPKEYGLGKNSESPYQWGHSHGPGTVAEREEGILLTPRFVNLKLQNHGIERFLRAIAENIKDDPNIKLWLKTGTTNIKYTSRLKEITYQIDAETSNGTRRTVLIATIRIEGTKMKPTARCSIDYIGSSFADFLVSVAEDEFHNRLSED